VSGIYVTGTSKSVCSWSNNITVIVTVKVEVIKKVEVEL
jgi:hypothetical protein